MANRQTHAAAVDSTRVTVVRGLALGVGALFTVIGVAGFVVTGVDSFAEPTGETLLGFGVNPLHNIVHLVLGIAGLAMAWSLSTARAYGWVLAVGYGLVLVFGLVVDEGDSANILNINIADNVLHAVTVLAGLVIALLPVKRTAPRQ
jgi:hypothetical protein